MGYTLITPESKKPEKNMLVTQSNKLVEARYTLTLYEQRLVLMMIAMIEPDDEDFKDYIIRVSDFGDLIGLKNKNMYSQIKSLLVKLRERTLVIEDGKDYLVTGWISSAKYVSNEGVVKLSFDSNLKPFLLQLKQEFTKQRLGEVIKFKGVYTIRIYGLLKQYQKLGTRTITVEDFRKMLGIADDKLIIFANLKARTILQAQKEFSRQDENGAYYSDINFTFEAIKTGRKITALKFNIFSQNTSPVSVPNITPPTPQEQGEQPQDEIYLKLVEIGIAKVKAEKYLVQYEAEYLKNKIDLLIDGLELGLVKSPAGYLTKAILEDWTSEKIAKKKLEKEKREKEEQARFEALTKELREKEISKLEKEFANLERANYLKTLSEEQKNELLEEYKAQAGFTGQYAKDLNDTFASIWLLKKIPNYKERKQDYINKNLRI